MSSNVIVKFVQNAPPYMAGEVAGFPFERARKLVQMRAAKYHGADAEESAPAKAADDAPAESDPTAEHHLEQVADTADAVQQPQHARRSRGAKA